MDGIHKGRWTAQMPGEFVVFLIGMRINNLLLAHKWGPVVKAMPLMLAELKRQPELGLLHAEGFVGWRTAMIVQYWRSFELLHEYAHARDKQHLPAWAAFNRRVGGNGSVGIFHETYAVREGEYESVYANMPAFGLAKAGTQIEAIGRMQSARSRMGREAS